MIWLFSQINQTISLLFQNSGIEKAFLFDVLSKIYIATDSSPVDMQSYELCCEMIDVVIDISDIYGWVFMMTLFLDVNFFFLLLDEWTNWVRVCWFSFWYYCLK